MKNEPEKLLKTKKSGQKTNRNEPENEAEKLLKTRSCGKNEPETNRKTKLPILLKTLEGENGPKGNFRAQFGTTLIQTPPHAGPVSPSVCEAADSSQSLP
ncbi:MAG TPA: hypothetical protein VFQ24_01490 [Terriglobia bacterium]|nr:hypothetical protein [Terriglobia bacterium]